jgi:hypothetical protein
LSSQALANATESRKLAEIIGFFANRAGVYLYVVDLDVAGSSPVIHPFSSCPHVSSFVRIANISSVSVMRPGVARRKAMDQMERELVERNHGEAIEQCRVQSPTPHDLSYTELPDAQPESPLYREWNFYRREVGRLLAQGHEKRFVLIKEESVIGIWSTREEAKAFALEKYLMQPCLIHQVCSREPIVRMSARFLACQG